MIRGRLQAVSFRDVLLNAMLVVLSVLLVFALFEAALQLGVIESRARSVDVNGTMEPQRIHCANRDLVGHLQFHSEYGWTEIPNTTYRERISPEDDWSIYRINEQGFRDVYDSGTNSSIILLGDSHTRGTLVDQNATFAHLLDRWTPETAVHNYGTSGYSTMNELAVYEDTSERDHEVVVLAYYLGNDAKGNIANHSAMPKYGYLNGTFQKVRGPKYVNGSFHGRGPNNGDNTGHENDKQTSYATSAQIPTMTTTDSASAITRLSKPIVSAALFPSFHQKKGATTTPTDTTTATPTDEGDNDGGIISNPILDSIQKFLYKHTATYHYLAPRLKHTLYKLGLVKPPQNRRLSTEEVDRQLKVTRGAIQALSNEAARQDAEVVVLIIPQAQEIRSTNLILQKYWDKQRAMLQAVANNRSNVRTVDITPKLRRRNRDGKYVYGRINTHLDDRGHRVVARQLYEALATIDTIESNTEVAFSTENGQEQTQCPS